MKLRKVLALTLAAAMTFSLAGCGSSDDSAAEDALLRLSTGDWGDIMFIPAVDKAELANYFQPMDSLENMKKEINFADAWQFDGTSYGVPCLANAQGVLYNKAVFEAAATGSETFDDIMADWTQSWNFAQEDLGIEVLY